ncbi:hypothetical protein B0H19DRAFT_1133930, partial [Mycena capillaripes]
MHFTRSIIALALAAVTLVQASSLPPAARQGECMTSIRVLDMLPDPACLSFYFRVRTLTGLRMRSQSGDWM